MKKFRCGKNIWPDADGPNEVNKFLKKYGVKLSFLLDDGVEFEIISESVEVNLVSNDSCYFIDSTTKSILIHYYESFGELVFESNTEKFTIPILEEIL